jgi:hypothetical protein
VLDDWTHHDWNLTFVFATAVYFIGAICWLFIDPVTPIEEPGESR